MLLCCILAVAAGADSSYRGRDRAPAAPSVASAFRITTWFPLNRRSPTTSSLAALPHPCGATSVPDGDRAMDEREAIKVMIDF